MSSIQRKQQRLDALLEREDNDPDAVDAVWSALDKIATDREYLDSDSGFRRHLIHYLSSHSGPDSCSCQAPNCPLNQGRLPPSLDTTTQPLETALEDWASRHSGTPHVLLDAVEEWSTREARVDRALSECATAVLTDNPDAISILNGGDDE